MEQKQKYNIEELRGTKINRLTILYEGEKIREGDKNRRTFICKCDCGVTKTIPLLKLMSGKVKGCGNCNENLIGKINGHLEVIGDLGSNKNRQRLLKVKCNNCGSESEMIHGIFNQKKHCGCIKPEPKPKVIKPIEINVVKGIYYIMEELPERSQGGRRMVKANCTKCGSEHSLVYSKIKNKDGGQSCKKCPPKEVPLEVIRLRVKHSNMISRCLRPSSKDYYNYGARGITVCEEWRKSPNFIKWSLDNGFKIGLEIDRIDNEGNYTPENCRWVTKRENGRNTRQTKLTEQDVRDIRYGDEYAGLTLKEIADIFKCSHTTIQSVKYFKSWIDI